MKPLILGVGNILLSDEGVGVRVVQELEKRPEIQPHFDIIDGGTCGNGITGCDGKSRAFDYC